MEIRTEADLKAGAIRWLRDQAKEPQPVFWARVGITQSTGCRYERGMMSPPKPVRLLLYAVYVAGLDLDSSTIEGAEKVARLGQLQGSEQAKQKAETAQAALQHLQAAGKLLNNL